MTRWILMLAIFVAGTPSALAQESAGGGKLNAKTFNGLALRGLGPALMSGRIADIAVDPVKPNTWYVAAGSGNLWKTENAGTTWTPIFDNYASYSIGCVTIDPSQRSTIWVGTGENVSGRHVGFGDGVYRSFDGGQSFENVGLKDSEHISKILVDPRDSNVVYVAAQGPLWSKGGERGLYKTTDGGTTWNQVLAKGPYTGVTDIAFDPRNADVVFAVTHQRHRTVAALLDGGPETGIFKSTDGGETWRELTRGLPSGEKGKSSIAISPQRPDVMYATIELPARAGGFFRSTNGGESWNQMSDYVGGGTGPHYYQEIWADPHRFDVVYHANVRLGRTRDGGTTWETVESPWKHVDNHAVTFHPTDPDFVLVGCDGGVYRSYDFCRTFQFCANLPLTQFYKLSVDNDFPFYNVVGGTQDNNTQYGPSRTNNASGIRNSDWITPIGGDGHDCAIDPQDPNIIYCESQRGYLRRFDRRSGTSVDIRPQPEADEEALRFNWDSPILISPHDNKRLYFGSRKLHRSDDRGDSWTAISPDLSRNLDRFRMPIMGRIWSIDAIWDLYAMSQFGNITSIAESPLVEGLLYVGTDDGLIQVSEDGGQNWRTVDDIYGLPKFAFVNDLKADLHDPNVVYAAFDDHKSGDYTPYLMRSDDRGRTWTLITGNLPARHLVWRVVQDHVEPKLLFAGTEFGLFFTVDGGRRWTKLSGGVPTIPFRDLEIQQRENDLIGATFGRGFYVLDDYSALRTAVDKLNEPFALFPVRKTLRYIPARVLGGEKGSQGDAFFTAPNPPYGAVLTYYLREGLATRKQARRKREQAIQESGGGNPRPSFADLRSEDRELEPEIIFTIRDAQGGVVNRVTGTTGAGFHRVAWDLSYAGIVVGNSGPLVLPGNYEVSAQQRVDGVTQSIGEPQTIEVVAVGESTLPTPEPSEVLAFQQRAAKLGARISAATTTIESTLEHLTEIRSAVISSVTPNLELLDATRNLQLALTDAQESLTGDTARDSRDQITVMSISDRARSAYRGASSSTYGPTKTHRKALEIATSQFESLLPALTKLIDTDFSELKKDLDAAGVPWTSGRDLPRQ